MRATDVLARVGGDEFALILPDMRPERAREVVERAREAATVTIEGEELTWCAGVACYPAHAEDPKTLYECADGALYCRQASGEGCTRVFDPKRVSTSRTQGERAEIAALLERPDAITPVFQPIVVAGHRPRVAATRRWRASRRRPTAAPTSGSRSRTASASGHSSRRAPSSAALAAPDRPAGVYLSFNLEPVGALLTRGAGGAARRPERPRHRDHRARARGRRGRAARAARARCASAARGSRSTTPAPATRACSRSCASTRTSSSSTASLVAEVDTDPAKAALIDAFARFARGTGAVVCAEGIETAAELRVVADLDVTYGQGFGLGKPQAAVGLDVVVGCGDAVAPRAALVRRRRGAHARRPRRAGWPS